MASCVSSDLRTVLIIRNGGSRVSPLSHAVHMTTGSPLNPLPSGGVIGVKRPTQLLQAAMPRCGAHANSFKVNRSSRATGPTTHSMS